MLVESFKKLIEEIKKLPGISKKQAEKIAYFLVSENKNIKKCNSLIEALQEAKEKVFICSECNMVSDKKICDFCLDKTRRDILFVVEKFLDVFKIETALEYKPKYFILDELISTDKNIPDSINKLKTKVKNFQEIVLALPLNLKGIITIKYLKKNLNHKKITELATGVPIGAEIEYVDKFTLKTAIENRKEKK